ncbi:inositol monophosphatase family protein [Streptomyces sp. NPDC059063]|uniref:inositol monophosphatase family protein n=1 Tax=unclassified Streptomyces TaxID=2593676 RepID=UPI0036793909
MSRTDLGSRTDLDARLPRIVAAMTDAAQETGALLTRLPRPEPARTLDELRTAFDAVDAPATAVLRDRLAALVPDAVWADELDTDLPATGQAWVADAIDGAVQYLRGMPYWCVSVALVEDGEPVAAVLHSAVLGETYTAARGFGARRDGVPLAPLPGAELDAAIVASSQPHSAAAQPEAVARAGRALSAVVPAVAAVRNLGPVSWQVADVAAGRLDAFWECGRDEANLLPGALIAREAGARVTDLDGGAWRSDAPGFLVAHGALHGRLLEVIGRGV